MLYSYKGNYPTQLPDRIRLSSGETRTDTSTFTDEWIADAGYVAVDNKPAYSGDTEKVEWNYEEVRWDIVQLDEQELAQHLAQRWVVAREERDLLLQLTDHKVMIAIEANDPVSDELRTYRHTLRNIPQTYNDPLDIVWPIESTY